jgi:hypothetical protein
MNRNVYRMIVVLLTVLLNLTGPMVSLANVGSDLPDTNLADNQAQATNQTAAYDPTSLSYGLYWFGKDQANQKFVVGETNDYFDPAKPTLVFAHGWQPYISDELPNFDFNGNDTIAAWVDDEWNVGIFVWNQFADETTGVTLGGAWFTDGPPQGVLDAEAKIWTPNGPQQMRWRDWSENLLIEDGYKPGPDKSAGQLFYETYIAALDGYTGTIRIAGHSLGNQMAVRLTKLVHDGIAAGEVTEDLRPARVALLDPYWSPDARDDLTDSDVAGRKTGDVVRTYIADLLPTGTLFEWYWSSEWTTPGQGDANDALKPMVLYAEMDPQYAGTGLDRHMAPRYLYFWAYEFPLSCDGVADECRLLGQMPDEQLATLMRSDYRWTQVAGQGTPKPDDDGYTATRSVGAPYTVSALQANPATQSVGGIITVTATVTGSADPAPDGVLVTFNTDLGEISARAATTGGVALAHITSDVAGTAHLTATTQGVGSPGQAWATAVFSTAQPTPTVSFSAAHYTVGEADDATVTATLQTPSPQTVTVDYSTSDGTATAGSDYITTSGTLTFTVGTTALTFTVPITDDDLVEADETLTLTLRQPVDATLGIFKTAILTIMDDDDVASHKIYLPLVLRDPG